MSATLSQIGCFEQLLSYLERELEWPIREMDIEDLTFEYDPREDLELGLQACASIRTLYQLRSLTVEQPFGIFFIEFEQRYLPLGLMRRILQALVTRRRAAANPVGRRTWRHDDLLFVATSGGERSRRIDFAHFAGNGAGAAPRLNVLGWAAGEPAARLEWVESKLRAHLHWPAEPDQDLWRRQWTEAFKYRPARSRGAWVDLNTASRQLLIDLYSAADLTVDALPYTQDFDWLVEAFNRATGLSLSHHEFWRALSSARKSGALVRKER